MSLSVFLFSDIEGSTRLWAAHSADMHEALQRHDTLLGAAVTHAGGTVFKHTGDGVVARFESAVAAIEAAVAAQVALAGQDWGAIGQLRARIGLHAGEAQSRDGDWFGPVLNRAARLMAVGHGGQILASGAVHALARDGLAGEMGFRDLGMHRLRDLAEPERVFQVTAVGLAESFPPLRSLDGSLTNLPGALSSFLGREREVREVVQALRDHRLVSLTGPGGVGKTRLALHAAAEFTQDFEHGVWLCELAAVAEVEAVDHALLAALGFVVGPGGTPRQAVVEALAERELLLIIDNCEHLRATVASLVAEILLRGQLIRVLTTSREQLGVPGEHVWGVEPLPVASEAVELFAERAGSARRGFSLDGSNRPIIADICRQLDGVPLAIESAAARTRSLGVSDLLEHLDERFRLLGSARGTGGPAHQATLRATLDWSYELLEADERSFFDALSVFAGGFDLAAATAVVGGPGADELDVLDLLTALVDKSMVRFTAVEGGSRYALLETMRHYGAERLADRAATSETASRHAVYFAAFAVGAATGLRGPQEAAWVTLLDADFDNLRAALQWSLRQGDVDIGVRLTGSLWSFPIDRMVQEPAEWAEQVLALPGADDHPLAALTHICAGYGAQQGGRYADALRHGEVAAKAARASSVDVVWLTHALAASGALFLGLREKSQEHLTGVIDSARATTDPYSISRALWFPLTAHRVIDSGMDVRAGAAEAFDLAHEVGNPTLLARAHLVNGIVAGVEDPAEVLRHLAASEQYAGAVGSRYLVGTAIIYGAAVVAVNDPMGGLKELLRALDWNHSTGSPTGILRALLRDLLPPLDELGLFPLVVLLDAYLPLVAMMGAARVEAAVEHAQQELGPEQTEALQRRGRSASDADVLALLRVEVEAVLAAGDPGSGEGIS